MSGGRIGVKASFSVGDKIVHEFESWDRDASTDPPDLEGTGNEVAGDDSDKYDHRYSGRHDHGVLPQLKSGGPHGELLGALQEAKQDSDRFLTSLLAAETKERADDERGARKEISGGEAENTASTAAKTTAVEHTGARTTQPAKRPKP